MPIHMACRTRQHTYHQRRDRPSRWIIEDGSGSLPVPADGDGPIGRQSPARESAQRHAVARASGVVALPIAEYDGRMTIDDHGADSSGIGRDVSSDALPAVDVIICAYTPKREAFLRRAIASVVDQLDAEQVIVVVDHAPELFGLLADDPTLGDGVVVIENAYEQGLSGARNTGVDYATAPVVAFLDDDARAYPGWVLAIRRAHADPATVGTGGWVAPEWEDGVCPAWLPSEFWWTIGCSYRGLPMDHKSVIRNPIGASMSFSRAPLQAVGAFRSGLGRIGTTPLGCEETEAAIRVQAAAPGSKIVHLTESRVGHYVPRTRTTWSYFRDRCVAEGRSKAMVAGTAGTRDGLSSERRYVLRVLPSGVLRALGDAARGDVAGLERAGAIVAGLALTAGGYVVGRTEVARVEGGAGPSAMRTSIVTRSIAGAAGVRARCRVRANGWRGHR
jgi:Glycosyl transferase family 2